jgi:hypothetical protein
MVDDRDTSRTAPSSPEPAPEPITELARVAVDYVRRALNVEMEAVPDALAFLDHYASTAPRDREDVLALLAGPLGAFFGEVVRQKLGGRWAATDGRPPAFRIELESCFLYFCPVGVAADVLTRGEAGPEYDPHVGVAPVDEEALEEELGRAQVEEDYFYSFTGRLETLERIADFLVSRRLQAATEAAGGNEPSSLPPISPATYDAEIQRRFS